MSETEGRVAGLLAAHGPALRRVARRWSLCDEDAEDALQRSLEIYVRRLATVERATEAAWLKVVIRNEALAIRRARGESVGREDPDLDGRIAADVRELDDRVAARERSARSAEALRELKHDEALALLMKAEGHSYQEIAASQGWTYTKVNRAITEGRARFLKTFRAIEEGEACERLAPVLAALATGSATSVQLREARPHLRHCAACRAALKALHVPLHRRVAALLPLGIVVEPLRWGREHLSRGGSSQPPGDLEPIPITRIEGAADKLPVAVEHAERATRVPSPRPALQALLHRVTSSDLATSIQLATGTGGGRTAAIAALIGVCLSGVGAGTYCMATALLPDPPVVRTAHEDAKRKSSERHPRASRPATAPSAKPRAMAVVTPPPTPTPPRRSQTPSRRRSGSSTAKTSTPQREFGFESLGSGGGSTSRPAASTASSGSSSTTGSRGGGSGGGGSATNGGEFLP
jgi:RNA polymerase sigma factor (sigma-70 family)